MKEDDMCPPSASDEASSGKQGPASQHAAMSDDEIDELINDPAQIATHAQAMEVIAVLDHEIAEIQSQIDCAQIEANARPLPSERVAWLRRATYACAMRKNDRHKIYQRDKELRGTKNRGNALPDPEKRELGRLKEMRLLEEAQARKAAKLAEAETQRTIQARMVQRQRELKAKLTYQNQFVMLAKQLLPAEMYDQVRTAALMSAGAPAQHSGEPETSGTLTATEGSEVKSK